MKNSISNIWLVGLVTLFIMTFAGFLAVTVSYSRAFKMRDMIISKIENYKGVTDRGPSSSSDGYTNPGTLQSINAYLVASGYKVKGRCLNEKNVTWYGVSDLNFTSSLGNGFGVSNNNKGYYYCISKYDANKNYGNKITYTVNNSNYYYKIRLFFKINLPVLGDVFTFNVDGRTNAIANTTSNDLIPESGLSK